MENGLKDTPDVFNHHSLRTNLIHKADHRRKEIALIPIPQLFSSHRERRAGQTARQDVDAYERRAVEMVKVCLDYVASRAIQAERRTRVPVDLHKGSVTYPGLLKSDRLPPGAGAQFQCNQAVGLSGHRPTPRRFSSEPGVLDPADESGQDTLPG
jgi:hypothetical protein